MADWPMFLQAILERFLAKSAKALFSTIYLSDQTWEIASGEE